MPRIARVVVPGCAHHVTQRGNYRQTVFDCVDDRIFYLETLRKYADLHGTRIWAWCLMPNHVHLIVVPENEKSLARTFEKAQAAHSFRMHSRRCQTGHLWQNRYYSCVLDDSHLQAAVRYVELNPVRAGLVDKPEDYDWSSAWSHLNKAQSPYLDSGCPVLEDFPDWRSFLIDPDPLVQMDVIRRCTKTGRPAAEQAFLARLELDTGRTLHAPRKGRPPRNLPLPCT
mgnify:CR=1 FL=1